MSSLAGGQRNHSLLRCVCRGGNVVFNYVFLIEKKYNEVNHMNAVYIALKCKKILRYNEQNLLHNQSLKTTVQSTCSYKNPMFCKTNFNLYSTWLKKIFYEKETMRFI